MECPTVQIDDGKGGFIVINESDFDEKKHTKFGEKAAKKADEKSDERKALEEVAKSLEVKFNKRTSDEKLTELVEAAKEAAMEEAGV